MEADDQGREVGLGEVLHLIEQEREADPARSRGAPDLDQQVAEVFGKVAGVGDAGESVDIEA